MRVFHLSRYFSTLSFALLLLAGAAMGGFVQHHELAQLTRMAQERNVDTTRVFKNALWSEFSPVVSDPASRSADVLRQQIRERGLHDKAAALMRDSGIVKIKVYNLNGLTVFSSDPKQIGEDKSTNGGFLSALAGTTVSELTHRNRFDAFEGTLSEIDVISSYIPVTEQGERVGVFEIYQDVTAFTEQIKRVVWQMWATVLGVLGIVYLAQLLVVRRAQAILHTQSEELVAVNRDLDRRVKERTADVENALGRLEAEVTERRLAEQRFEHLAHHDPLTGLPNRLLFHEQLMKSLSLAQRNERQIALLFIDLDRFKDVNDTLGHAIGDELLVAATRRLVAHLRGGDSLARLGGDEFVCILEDIKEPHEASGVANKLIELLETPLAVREHELFISASIGISLYPSDGADVQTLVRNADTAMYQAKAHGRGRSHFYTPEMTTYAQERVRIEALLRRSIEAEELDVHYQIKVAATTGLPVGVEALARWNSAELGAVTPVRFIPVAEETGFIVELGAWVLRTACRQLAAWRAQGIAIPKVSVNLSVKQLERPDIVETVQSALDDAGLAADSLELEITESIIMAVGDTFDVLERLKVLGVQIAIDDFGTGYSSLSYLKLLPIHTLKIDRAFVVGIGQNTGDEAIIRAIVALAASLSLSTVAEGVDAEHQIAFLRELGCNQIQGFFYGKPEPADTFAAQWRAL